MKSEFVFRHGDSFLPLAPKKTAGIREQSFAMTQQRKQLSRDTQKSRKINSGHFLRTKTSCRLDLNPTLVLHLHRARAMLRTRNRMTWKHDVTFLKVRNCAAPPDHLRGEISFSATCSMPNIISYTSYFQPGFRRNRPNLPGTKFATTVLCGCSNKDTWIIALGSMPNGNIRGSFRWSKKVEKHCRTY